MNVNGIGRNYYQNSVATTENVNNADQKVFHRDTLEISQLSNNREEIVDKLCKAIF